MSIIHEKYAVIPEYQAPSNIILICKKHYIVWLKIYLVMASSQCNLTYTATTLSKEEIIDKHMSVLSPFGLSWKMLIKIFSYYTGYQLSVNTNNVISPMLPGVLPSHF